MGMTRRRREFLASLVSLYDAEGRAVHYAAVARAVGVSKWTAYDMLKALEAEGYLRGEYRAPATSGGGRSVILFAPTERGRASVREPVEPDSREWLRLREFLLAKVEGSAQDGARVMEDVLKDLSNVHRPLARAAQCVTVLAVALRQAGQEHLAMVRNLAVAMPIPEVRLGFLRGAALMSLLSGSGPLSPEAVERLQRNLSEALAAFGREDRRRLADFMAEALN